MKRILTVILFILVIFPGFALYIIKGKIVDANTQEPLDYVNVALYKPDTETPAAGVVTDEKGNFVLPQVPNGKYTLKVSFVGYNPIAMPLKVDGKELNMGQIKLVEDSKALNEVQVLGQGTQMKFDIDKKVFSVDQNIASAGGSATEVLQNIPSVDVDNEGNVSLRNSGSVEVWINGKPSGLTAENRAQVLQQMPAESIESIEVMTNPSAKFNPEGTAGIINIVLKKNRKAGYYGSVSAGAMYSEGGKPTGTLGASLNYSSSKIDANFNIGYRSMSFVGGSETNRFNLTGTDTIGKLNQSSINERAYGGVFFRGGIDYHLSSKHTISLSGMGMYGSGGGNTVSNITFTDFSTQSILRQYRRNVSETGMRQNINASLDYKWDIDKLGSNLLASLSYSEHKRGGESDIAQTDILTGGTEESTLDITQSANGSNKEWLFKVDYTKKFTANSRLEAGWQSSLSNRFSPASAYNNLTNTDIFAYFNEFNYNEQIHAGYLTYGTRFFDKLSFQGGLRAEYMLRAADNTIKNGSGTEISSPIELSPSFRLFPSMYLSYSLPENNELQLNYTSRINRPRGRQINPFHDYSDSTNISYGNATLTPEYANALEFNYIKSWDNHSLSASAYYRFTDQIIQDVQFMNGGTMESTYMNLSRSTSSGIELVAKNRLFKIINLTSSLNLYYNKLDSSIYVNPYNTAISTTIPGQENFTWSGRVMANIILGKTTFAQVSGEYSAPRLIAQGRETASYSIDLGLRQTFFNRNLSLNLMVRDLLNTRKRNTETWGTGFYQTNQSYFNGRMIGLTLTYNFGNMKPKQSERKKTESTGNDMNMDGMD